MNEYPFKNLNVQAAKLVFLVDDFNDLFDDFGCFKFSVYFWQPDDIEVVKGI